MKQNLSKNQNKEKSNLIRTIEDFVQVEYIEKKSRFIAQAYPVCSIEEVEKLLKVIRGKYSDATHNCYAYILGISKDLYRYGDDGEPSGTAGKPIYQTIVNFDLTNILVVITRYFGGIKLGASGLVRAYSTATKLVLESARIVEKPILENIAIDLSYNEYTKVKNIIYNNFVEIKETFSDKVFVVGKIPINIKDEFVEKINNILSRKIITGEK
ncbi:MAG: IMPACT family protein [Candidatus Kapaibacteriota bacterium]